MRYSILRMLLAACGATAAGSDDPFVGTWKLDTDSAHNNWGGERPKRVTRTYTRNDKGLLTF